MSFLLGFFAGLVGCAIGVTLVLGLCRFLGLYITVDEGHCKVFTLFGKVIGILREPGITFLFTKLGPQAFLLPYFGKTYDVDTRLDQEYLRSQPVNSEEGTPMGIGVWYEMYISDPEDFLFKNTDPSGSLQANVTNATVRSLSNMPLGDLLENRHAMSRVVRAEVSPKSIEWGYRLGSVYIRKVHFRDADMINQIEEKVANRLRQVTAAIRQAGANQVEVIKSAAEKEAASEFARAATMRPRIVGQVMDEISRDREVLDALLEIMDIGRTVGNRGRLILVPPGEGDSVMTEIMAADLAADGGGVGHGGPRDAAPTVGKAGTRGQHGHGHGHGGAPALDPGLPSVTTGVPPDATRSVQDPDPMKVVQGLAKRFGKEEQLETIRGMVDAYQQARKRSNR